MTTLTTPKIRAVVFDLDGLMLNTEAVFHLTGHELMRRRGRTATPELFLRMMGRRADEAFGEMIDHMQLTDTIPALKKESEEVFRGFMAEHLRPMPGLFVLLERIEACALPKAVATSSDRKYMTEMLHRFQLWDRFQTKLTAEDVTHGKPNPEIYLKAAERLQVEPHEMLVLEDSEAGTRAAAAAGAHIISIPHEHSRAHDFSVARAIARSLHDPLILGLFPQPQSQS